MELSETFYRFGIALGLGLLVGLQRERSDARLAGFRTYPLITLLGAVTGALASPFGGWTIGLGLVALAGIIVTGNLARLRAGETDSGLTSEIAMLLMFGVGAYLPSGHVAVAVTLGGTVAVLLHLKPQMHSLAKRIGDEDFRAIMQFVLITLVILPVLPNRAFGPYQVLNPYKIWLMVVLIVGISLAGYVAYKLLGERVGALVGGVLGGLISSTATTVSYSRTARQTPDTAALAALVIAIASTVVFARVLILIGATAPTFLKELAPPLGAMLVALSIGVGLMILAIRPTRSSMLAQGNPTQLRSAIAFGILFSVVLLAVAASKQQFGDRGLYVVAVLSGLTDMDAVTLSTMQLVQRGTLGADTAWRAVLIAAMANLVFKGTMVALLGNRPLFIRVGAFFAGAFLLGALILAFWPAPSALSAPH